MSVGDCQRAFGDAARRDGIVLIAAEVEGLTDAGHLALPGEVGGVRTELASIFRALRGDEEDLARGVHRALRPDWFHEPTGTVIEIDEFQHFTSDRLLTLERYPSSASLGFDRLGYIALCEETRERADRYRATKEARGFRWPGGRRAQRAYFDAVRDLALPALGYQSVVRIPAIDGDGRAAYAAHRVAIRRAIEAPTWPSSDER